MSVIHIDDYKQCNSINEISDNAKSIISFVKLPCLVYEEGYDYDTLMKEFKDMTKAGLSEGYTPLIVLADEYFYFDSEENYSPQETLNSDLSNGKKLLNERFKYNLRYVQTDVDEYIESISGEYDDDCEKMDCPFSFFNFETKSCYETIVFKIPTTNPWELPAYIPFGGWNECPDAKEMTSICKYWYDQYGAVPIAVTHDILEMEVPKPVSSEISIEVAKEHYAFCPDRLYQCTQSFTLSEIAKSLEGSTVWYFWWD